MLMLSTGGAGSKSSKLKNLQHSRTQKHDIDLAHAAHRSTAAPRSTAGEGIPGSHSGDRQRNRTNCHLSMHGVAVRALLVTGQGCGDELSTARRWAKINIRPGWIRPPDARSGPATTSYRSRKTLRAPQPIHLSSCVFSRSTCISVSRGSCHRGTEGNMNRVESVYFRACIRFIIHTCVYACLRVREGKQQWLAGWVCVPLRYGPPVPSGRQTHSLGPHARARGYSQVPVESALHCTRPGRTPTKSGQRNGSDAHTRKWELTTELDTGEMTDSDMTELVRCERERRRRVHGSKYSLPWLRAEVADDGAAGKYLFKLLREPRLDA
ncbi:hypothetical protein C8Q74DRAFT_1388327 [Fomes fomentarius]|nr:hypothetical protein C8Q74DRAFT_1388327 [Fomes fomentarius]